MIFVSASPSHPTESPADHDYQQLRDAVSDAARTVDALATRRHAPATMRTAAHELTLAIRAAAAVATTELRTARDAQPGKHKTTDRLQREAMRWWAGELVWLANLDNRLALTAMAEPGVSVANTVQVGSRAALGPRGAGMTVEPTSLTAPRLSGPRIGVALRDVVDGTPPSPPRADHLSVTGGAAEPDQTHPDAKDGAGPSTEPPARQPAPADGSAPSSDLSEPGPRAMVLQHARLAQQLAEHVGILHNARADDGDIAGAIDGLRGFVRTELAPYVRAEQRTIEEDPSKFDEPGGRFNRRGLDRRRQTHEHARLAAAFAGLTDARTPKAVLRAADHLREVFDAHISREDAHLLRVSERPDEEHEAISDAGLHPDLAQYLMTEIAEEHKQIDHALLASDRAIYVDRISWVEACEAAIAALSAHASLVSMHLYPVADDALGAHATTRHLAGELRTTELALLRIHGILRGDARQNPRHFQRLWSQVEDAFHRHIKPEESLVRDLGAHATNDQLLDVLGNMRKGARAAATRPHPRAVHTGPLAGLAARASSWLDRVRDGLDSRST